MAKKTLRSNSVSWDTTTPEVYEFPTGSWDVRAAKKVIVAKPRTIRSLTIVGMEPFCAMHLGECPKGHLIDLTIPVVAVTTRRGNILPVDGWNRIAKALAEGMTELPMVVLTKAESLSVEV